VYLNDRALGGLPNLGVVSTPLTLAVEWRGEGAAPLVVEAENEEEGSSCPADPGECHESGEHAACLEIPAEGEIMPVACGNSGANKEHDPQNEKSDVLQQMGASVAATFHSSGDGEHHPQGP